MELNMAKFKILGGSLSDSAELKNKKATQKLKEGGKLTALHLTFGNCMLEITTKWGSSILTDTTPTLINSIEEITEITEENAVNFKGAAGWAIVGGVLTGGVGVLAGALLGGRGKEVTFAIRLKDESQFLCTGKTKNYTALLAASGKF